MLVSPFLLRGLCACVRDRGISADELLREAELPLELLEQTRGFIDADALIRATLAAVRLTREPGLALRWGAEVPPQMVSLVGALFVHCTTLRAALSEAQRYMPLIVSHGTLSLREEGSTAQLQYHTPKTSPVFARLAVELCLSLVVSTARGFVGRRADPICVRLPYAPPDHLADYQRVFGAAELEFNAQVAELVFERAYLDRPQLLANERVLRLLKEQADGLLLSEARAEPLRLRVGAILREDESGFGDPGRKLLSKRLGISARSLRRLLAREGTTLFSLLENARKEHAFHLLSETQVPLKDIAERLGFSEASAFHRAFKRWTGQTPAQFRLMRVREAVGVDGWQREAL